MTSASYGIRSVGKLIIDCTDITINSNKSGIYVSSDGSSSGLDIKGGTVSVSNNLYETIYSSGDINILGGEVIACHNDKTSGSDIIVSNNNVFLDGGSVTATQGMCGLYSYSYHIYLNDGYFSGNHPYGGTGITMSDKMIVTEPEGCVLSDEGKKFVKSDGKEAYTITIESATSVRYPVWVGNT